MPTRQMLANQISISADPRLQPTNPAVASESDSQMRPWVLLAFYALNAVVWRTRRWCQRRDAAEVSWW